MVQLADFPWNQRMYENADQTVLTKAVAAVENGYSNAAGGHSRFPGLKWFSKFVADRVYLHRFRDNLVAVNDEGRIYRISRDGTARDFTGVPVSGGQRVIFSDTEDQVVMSAGGPIISLSGPRSQVLARDAPLTTHVAFLQGYLLAIEANSERFFFCNPGDYQTWDPLSVFSANGKPTDVTALQVTPYGELMLSKRNSIEQYELLPNGTQPFTRRWFTGEGILYPYTMIADKTGTYGVNDRFEFVRFTGQISADQGADVGLTLEHVDDWTDAWAQELSVKGQKTMVLQAPFATNVYGSKGITWLLDYRGKRWSHLYGWDIVMSRPARYPIWSVERCWGKVFAGVPGGVAVFDDTVSTLLEGTYPFLIRSAHVSDWGASRIDEVHIRLKRGVGEYGGRQPKIGLRVNRDNEGFDQWTEEPMGLPGQSEMTIRFGGQGCVAGTWQFEIRCTDPVPFEFVAMQVYVERLRW